MTSREVVLFILVGGATYKQVALYLVTVMLVSVCYG